MNPDKFLTDLAALTGKSVAVLSYVPGFTSGNVKVTFWCGDNLLSGTGPTVEAAMQDARAKLAEHYA